MSRVRPLEVTKLHIDSQVQCRFATTTIISHVKNHVNKAQETVFIAVLPDAAYLTYFEMKVDGKPIVDDVKEKEEAKREYEAAKNRGETASHLKKVTSELNAYYVAVNVAAEGNIRFKLIYQELLQRSHGVYTHLINFSPQQPVTDLRVAVTIIDSSPIINLHVPTIAAQLNDKSIQDLLRMEDAEDVHITNVSPSDRRILWHPDIEEQKKYVNNEEIISGQLVVIYDVERKEQVLVVDNHFIHFFAPKDLIVGPKNIVFALDTSCSMGVRKLGLANMAVRVILSQLDSNDRFGILCFDSSPRGIRKMPSVLATAASKAEAINFITVHTAGGSDIVRAVQESLGWLKNDEASGHQQEQFLASMVILLTDGLHNPPDGFTADQIVPRALACRHPATKLYCLAFGIHADFSLLHQLAVNTGGFARRIYEDLPDAPIDDGQFKDFYDEIASPLLADLKIKCLSSAVEAVTMVQNTDADTLYKGSEHVVIGKINPDRKLKKGERLIEWMARFFCGTGTRTTNFDCCYEPWTPKTPDAQCAVSGMKGGFVERAWAYLWVKTRLAKADVEVNLIEAERMRAEALTLALQYQFVTELTSMVLVQKTGKSTKREDDIMAHIINIQPIVDDVRAAGAGPVDVFGDASGHVISGDPSQNRMAVTHIHIAFVDQLAAMIQTDLIAALEQLLQLVNVTAGGERDKYLLSLLEQLVVKRFPAMGAAGSQTMNEGMIAQLFNAKNPLHIVKLDGERCKVMCGKKLMGVGACLLKTVQLLVGIMKKGAEFWSMADENPLLALLAVEAGDSGARASDYRLKMLALARDILAHIDRLAKDQIAVNSAMAPSD